MLTLLVHKIVSTLIRPHSRMRQPCPQNTAERKSVSTLIRPHSRMRLIKIVIFWTVPRFNPHPTSQPDATRDSLHPCRKHYRFQPSSDLTAGCDMFATFKNPQGDLVSTLIRPHSRMRLTLSSPTSALTSCFNPHPTSQPDATLSGV